MTTPEEDVVPEEGATPAPQKEAAPEAKPKTPVIPPELAEVVKDLPKSLVEMVQKAVQDAVSPLKQKLDNEAMVAKFGLNDEQKAALDSLRQQHPTLDMERSIRLLQLEQPDLFRRGGVPARFAGMPPGGTAVRGAGAESREDPLKKMNEAKTQEEATYWARKRFQQLVQPMSPTRPKAI